MSPNEARQRLAAALDAAQRGADHPDVDESRWTPAEAVRYGELVELHGSDYRNMPMAALKEIHNLQQRVVPPEPSQGAHGRMLNCDCGLCEHYRWYFRLEKSEVES